MNIDTAQHLTNYKTAAKNRLEQKLITNRFQQQASDRRTQQQFITKRVEGNTLETNRLNIAA